MVERSEKEEMENHITSISESSCEFVESLDTSYPGLIELSRKLVADANRIVTTYNNGEYDPILTGEMLLLAGYSSLLYAQDSKPTNFAVHLENLILKGEKLPVQSIYIAMKKEEKKRSTHMKKTSTKTEREKEENKGTQHTSSATIKNIEQHINYDAIQAALDAETPEEVRNAVEELRLGASRFAGQPSARDDPMPESLSGGSHNPSSSLRLPMQASGLHGGHD